MVTIELEERYCNICNEEASLFCRLCNLHYCFDHMCSHLQVAHEDNSYTKRLQLDIDTNIDEGVPEDENKRVQENVFKTEQTISEDLAVNMAGAVLLQADAKPPQSYSTIELQAQLDFYRNQARRIRNELERRALFASGVVPSDYAWEEYSGDNLSKHGSIRRKRNIRSRLPKSIFRSVEILSYQIRTGSLSLEQIKAQITASQATASKESV